MKLFFTELFRIDSGVTCYDSGFLDLSTAQECSDSVRYAKSFISKAHYEYDVTLSWGIPKGCSMHDDGSMYFNTHSTGGRSSSYTSICKKGNT